MSEPAPRIPIRNLWVLLLYAEGLARWAHRFAGEVEAAPSLRGLLASILCSSLEPLLRRGLGTEFVRHDATIPGIRGRLRLTPSLVHLERGSGRTVCAVRSRSPDSTRNRIVRATLRILLGDPALGENRQRVRELLHRLEGVADIRLDPTIFSRLQLGRSDSPWRLPLGVCQMTYRLELPSEASGDRAMASLLKDELVLHELFEKFVRAFYGIHHAEWAQPSRTCRWWTDDGPDRRPTEHPLLPTMRPDIVLRRPDRMIVIDTKFYRHALTRHHDTDRFRSEHLYQIYAYLRTQEAQSPQHRAAEGVLLYPTVGRALDESFVVQGHRLRVKTLDLMQPWEGIAASLASVLSNADRAGQADFEQTATLAAVAGAPVPRVPTADDDMG